MTLYGKDADERVDYSIDFAPLLAKGERLSTSQWTVEAAGAEPELIIEAPLLDGAKAAITVSGGRAHNLYRLRCQVTTSESRLLERGIAIRIVE